jgi:hypothetical protein
MRKLNDDIYFVQNQNRNHVQQQQQQQQQQQRELMRVDCQSGGASQHQELPKNASPTAPEVITWCSVSLKPMPIAMMEAKKANKHRGKHSREKEKLLNRRKERRGGVSVVSAS